MRKYTAYLGAISCNLRPHLYGHRLTGQVVIVRFTAASQKPVSRVASLFITVPVINYKAHTGSLGTLEEMCGDLWRGLEMKITSKAVSRGN